MKRNKRHTTEQALEIILSDSGTDVILEDSSSEEDSEPQPDNDSDYQLPTEESDEEDEEDEPGPSASTQPPSRGLSRRASAPPPPPPQPEQFSPCAQQKPGKAPAKRRRSDPAATEGERWHNREEKDRKPEPLKFAPAREPGPTFDRTAAWTPLSLFQLFFSASVIRTIIDNTNANAAKRIGAGLKFRWAPLTVRDFYTFLSIIVFSGLVEVHNRADYWRRKWPYNFAFPRENMSRDRFEAILWSLHLSSSEDDEENDRKRQTANYDRLCKIKPLYTEIVAACMAHFQPYRNICVDERMVASKARISMKQYMKDKPTKWGYKLFVLADSATGYTWNFSVYSGKTDKPEGSAGGHGLSYSSVVDLMPFSVLGSGYTLFVDNFYTSPALFQDLHRKNIACCGTIRKNLVGFPNTVSNGFPKNPDRGDIRWIRRDPLLFVKWMDTREVAVCSTLHEAFSGKTVKRKVKEAGVWQTKSIPVPDCILDYNANMGGVDLSDALIGYYSVHHKSMKWYKTFFYHFLDIAIVNSFILYKEICKTRADLTEKSHKMFREQLAAEMLSFEAGSAPQPAPMSTCMPAYYGTDATQSRRYCRRCQDRGTPRVKTPVYCRKCNVPLCLTAKKNCFSQWHDGQ
ncbi:piggyBac transposable element-derived protein 4-like isoform X1 [Salarias fasciatus]|uniref:piggyBac transposable element-derived protein 4-like isoform X1 n=1 Tax=Salarias fasciatus TaxID=181472 RepID=UPI001176BFFE|nr:piggyBac transposable element-derived protein 4-like isoform X1 [Salarias fasciatus]